MIYSIVKGVVSQIMVSQVTMFTCLHISVPYTKGALFMPRCLIFMR